MPILFRYLLSMFLSGIAKVGMVFVGLFLLGDGIEQMRRHLHLLHVGWEEVVLLLVLRLPGFLTQLLPAFALLATLLVLTRLSKQNEISILRASGISIYRILLPFLMGGMILCLIQIYLQDHVTPFTTQAAEALHREMTGEKNPSSTIRHNLWLRQGEQIIFARQAMIQPQLLLDVTVFQFQGMVLTARSDARKAQFYNEQWRLVDGYTLRFGEAAATEHFTEKPWSVHLDISQWDRSNPDPEYLSTLELLELADRLKQEGYDDNQYRLLFHRKLSDPMTTLAAIVLAFPFALRLPRVGMGRRSLMVGVLAGFALFVLVDLSSALGMGGRLPPVLAAWWPAIFFASMGGFFLVHLEENLSLTLGKSTG